MYFLLRFCIRGALCVQHKSATKNAPLITTFDFQMTIRKLLVASSVLCVALTSSCGLFDSGIEWRGGPYILLWIDDHKEVVLNYDIGQGSSVERIESRVIAVGWNGRYLVAKQHPKSAPSNTNFFILDSQADQPYADISKVVVGPMSEEEFHHKRVELSLPEFSKVLDSL